MKRRIVDKELAEALKAIVFCVCGHELIVHAGASGRCEVCACPCWRPKGKLMPKYMVAVERTLVLRRTYHVEAVSEEAAMDTARTLDEESDLDAGDLVVLSRSLTVQEDWSRVEYDRETDGRWIADYSSVIPGAMAYGMSQSDAFERLKALVAMIRSESI